MFEEVEEFTYSVAFEWRDEFTMVVEFILVIFGSSDEFEKMEVLWLVVALTDSVEFKETE